jgi:hypothetical protein
MNNNESIQQPNKRIKLNDFENKPLGEPIKPLAEPIKPLAEPIGPLNPK